MLHLDMSTFSKFGLNRFKSQEQNSQQNLLSYIFFYITFAYGIAFAFFKDTDMVKGTALSGTAVPPIMWGAVSLLVILAVAFTIQYKWRKFAKYVGVAGFSLWFYIFLVASITAAWFAAFIVSLPMVLFWAFWFFGINADHGDRPL